MDGIVEIDNPDQFYELEVNSWLDSLREVADEFTEQSGLDFTSTTDLSNHARRWEDGDRTMDLVLHLERDPKTGEHFGRLLILPGIRFQDYYQRINEGEKIDHWEKDGVLFLDGRKRKRVLESVKRELPKTWKKTGVLTKV